MYIEEIIEKRKSVRSYTDKEITSAQKDDLLQAAREIENPFGNDYTVKLKSFDLEAGFKPSTYGFIKGASEFFLVAIGKDIKAQLAAGFGFEYVVLKATEMGLGTCWIGGTFKGFDFDKGENWSQDQSLKIISPVGYAAQPRLLEKLGRKAMGSDNRKPFDKMFFTKGFSESLYPENEFAKALRMLRLAPSSTNSQPWRACVEDDTVHFYLAKTGELSYIDLGIGLCHFYLTEKSENESGDFFTSDRYPKSSEGWKYVCSYKRNK